MDETNVKNCPHCGKELPSELQFCPYCMNRLVDSQVVLDERKRTDKKILIAAAFLAAAVAVSIFFEFRYFFNSRTVLDKAPAAAASAAVDQLDFTRATGLWYPQSQKNPDTFREDGGARLQIVSVNKNSLRFNLIKVSQPPQNRWAEITNATAEIIGDTAYFTFRNDGWGNMGSGTIKIVGEQLYADVKITDEQPNSMYSLEMQTYFVKRIDILRLDNCLYMPFKDIKGSFGVETEVVKRYNEEHKFGCLSVSLPAYEGENGRVLGVNVSYNEQSDREKYSVWDIDGTKTYDEVVGILGQPDVNGMDGYDSDEKYLQYTKDDKALKIYFDDALQITGFNYFIMGID